MTLIKTRLKPWLKAMLIVLGWAASNAASALNGIFQGVLIPRPIYGGGGALPISAPIALGAMFPPQVALQAIEQPLQSLEFLGVSFGKWIFLLQVLATAVLGSFLVEDFGRAFLAFISSYALGTTIVFVVIILPGLTGAFSPPDALVAPGISFTFVIFFPVPLFLGLVGTLIGVLLAERFS